MGNDDFCLDLLFYHLNLRCFVVVELKHGDFKLEQLTYLLFLKLAHEDAQEP